MSVLIYTPKNIAVGALARVLSHSGILFDFSYTEIDVLDKLKHKKYTSILVIHTEDLGSLISFYNRWKQSGVSNCAFIVITKKQSGADRVQALHHGIESYHITPFSYTQLVMDIAQYEYLVTIPERTLNVDGFTINLASRTARFNGEYLSLTKKQFELLTLFLRHPNQVFSRVQIWERIWQEEEYPLANTVDVHINRLRKKLPAQASRLIETVYGFGYRLRARASA